MYHENEHVMFVLFNCLVALFSTFLTKHHSGDHINKNEMGGECGTYGDDRGADRFLMVGPDGMKPLGMPRHR